MPRRRWDDPWQCYPASVPLPAEGGVATSKQRGPMALTWWSRRFTEVLEAYGLGGRMQRGRRYARTGQVLGLEVRTGVLAAQVQGSRRTPYLVTVTLPEPSAAQWAAIDTAVSAKVGFVARLLAGEMPPDLEAVFAAAGVALFPTAWDDLQADCSCPDWESPCKHIAAVLYVFADRLDDDPWLALVWRGRTRDDLLAAVGGRGRGDREAHGEEVAPWWPFPPGPVPVLAEPVGTPIRLEPVADRPDAVLDALEPLEVEVGGAPFVERLATAYDHIVK